MQDHSNPPRAPIYIFDLDGTIALIEHRRHLVEAPLIECVRDNLDKDRKPQKVVIKGSKAYVRDPDFKPDWRGFFAACVNDEPNTPVIDILLHLYGAGMDVRIWSGRSAEVRRETVNWLSAHTELDCAVIESMLLMRPAGDFTPDDKLKADWFRDIITRQGLRPYVVGIFDDRQKVVDMWRANGIACFQVAPGNF